MCLSSMKSPSTACLLCSQQNFKECCKEPTKALCFLKANETICGTSLFMRLHFVLKLAIINSQIFLIRHKASGKLSGPYYRFM